MSAATTVGNVGGTGHDPTFLVGAANQALCRAWRLGVFRKPAIDAQSLAETAMGRERACLDSGEWQQALAILTDDLQREARLNPLGRTIAHALIGRTLQQRIRAARLWRRHPEILEQPVEQPVIVLGQMRSGTTRLHRLLACDPRFAFTRLHESLLPIPRSRTSAVLSTSLAHAFVNACNPMLRKIHPSGATMPEEEFGLHGFSLHGAMFEAQWHLPGFARWCEARDPGPVYDEFRKLVQTLRWRRGDDASKIQVLKAPQFMQELDAVLAAFPGARILWLQRDLREVAASSASLAWHQQQIQSDEADPLRTGREWQRKTALRQERAERALLACPKADVLPLEYGEMNADWRREVRCIYDFLGLELRDDAVGRMTRVAQGSAHTGHSYCREQFGLA